MTQILILKAKLKDIKFLFNLYNASIVEKVSNTKKKISYNCHKVWFLKNFNSKVNKIFILLYRKIKVGYIRMYLFKNKSCSISIYIKKKNRHKNLGSLYLMKIFNYIKNKEGVNYVYAEVLKKNMLSQSFFLKNGFNLIKVEKNFVYLKKI